MLRKIGRRWAMAMVCVVGAADLACAQDLTGARACAGIADKEARLACYDAAFAPTAAQGVASAAAPGVAPASAAAPAVVVPPAATAASTGVPATAASPAVPTTAAGSAAAAAQFGDSGQQRPQPKANLPKKLDLKVQSVAPAGQGLYRLTLENGQVWVTEEVDSGLEFKSGDTVTISRMLFGAYQISLVGRGRSVGVKRIH